MLFSSLTFIHMQIYHFLFKTEIRVTYRILNGKTMEVEREGEEDIVTGRYEN